MKRDMNLIREILLVLEAESSLLDELIHKLSVLHSPTASITTETPIPIQIREVDLATDYQHRRDQRYEKSHLRFAKTPTLVSRLCTMASIAIYPVCFVCSCTLFDRSLSCQKLSELLI